MQGLCVQTGTAQALGIRIRIRWNHGCEMGVEPWDLTLREEHRLRIF